MNVGKIDNLIVQDFKDVFTSSDLNTVFKHKYLFWLVGTRVPDKVVVRRVKAYLVEQWDFISLLQLCREK